MKKQTKYLIPSDFVQFKARIKPSGIVHWYSKDMKYFSETYCNVPYSIVNKYMIKFKMLELYNSWTHFDNNGFPIREYSDSPKPVDLFN